MRVLLRRLPGVDHVVLGVGGAPICSEKSDIKVLMSTGPLSSTTRLSDGRVNKCTVDTEVASDTGVVVLHSGVIVLHSGVVELHSGVVVLHSGVIVLDSGVVLHSCVVALQSAVIALDTCVVVLDTVSATCGCWFICCLDDVCMATLDTAGEV